MGLIEANLRPGEPSGGQIQRLHRHGDCTNWLFWLWMTRPVRWTLAAGTFPMAGLKSKQGLSSSSPVKLTILCEVADVVLHEGQMAACRQAGWGGESFVQLQPRQSSNLPKNGCTWLMAGIRWITLIWRSVRYVHTNWATWRSLIRTSFSLMLKTNTSSRSQWWRLSKMEKAESTLSKLLTGLLDTNVLVWTFKIDGENFNDLETSRKLLKAGITFQNPDDRFQPRSFNEVEWNARRLADDHDTITRRAFMALAWMIKTAKSPYIHHCRNARLSVASSGSGDLFIWWADDTVDWESRGASWTQFSISWAIWPPLHHQHDMDWVAAEFESAALWNTEAGLRRQSAEWTASRTSVHEWDYAITAIMDIASHKWSRAIHLSLMIGCQKNRDVWKVTSAGFAGRRINFSFGKNSSQIGLHLGSYFSAHRDHQYNFLELGDCPITIRTSASQLTLFPIIRESFKSQF